MKKILPFIMIALGASLWGIIAVFVKGLGEYGFTAMEIVAARVFCSNISCPNRNYAFPELL
ncbi:hypothetical protein [Cytobacillus pseudoceanisediminis]|uniref:hypothetical protein n=1 Tax=Cytobacillus pseudoceanisediminis TaxID=3051614 RepID=UPI0034E22BC5